MSDAASICVTRARLIPKRRANSARVNPGSRSSVSLQFAGAFPGTEPHLFCRLRTASFRSLFEFQHLERPRPSSGFVRSGELHKGACCRVYGDSGLPDPAGVSGDHDARLAAFRDVRDELRRRLGLLFSVDAQPT